MPRCIFRFLNALFSLRSFLLFSICTVAALPKSRIIEDTDQAVVYSGDEWNSRNAVVKPDPSRASEGSWHDGTQDWTRWNQQKFLEISFRGSGIELFGIIANNLKDPGIATKADYEFVLDGVTQPNHYRHTKSSGDEYIYHQSIFRKTGLPEGDHKIRVNLIADHVDPAADSSAKVAGATLILFDNAVITFDDGTPPPNANSATSLSDPKSKTDTNTASGTSSLGSAQLSPSSSTRAPPITGNPTDATAANTSLNLPMTNQTALGYSTTPKASLAPVIGGVVGGLIALILACFLVFCLLRRRKRKSQDAFLAPYTVSPAYTDALPRAPLSPTSNSFSNSRANSRSSLLKPVRRMDEYSDSSWAAGQFVELTSTSSRPNSSSQSPSSNGRSRGSEFISGSGSAQDPGSQHSESVSGSEPFTTSGRNSVTVTAVRNMLQQVEDLAQELRIQQQQWITAERGPPPGYGV